MKGCKFMTNKKKTIPFIIVGALVAALAIGVVAVVSTSAASRLVRSNRGLTDLRVSNLAFNDGSDSGFAHFGKPGFPGRGGARDEYLAEALGISVEELHGAMENTRIEAIDQALEDGLITEAQAEALKENHRGLMGKLFGRRGLFPGMGGTIDHEALLAEELGITVEELQAARQGAADAAVQAAIESGELTQEQVAMMEARKALADYIDRKALMAKALGLTVDELQDALEDGHSFRNLIEESGLTAEELHTAMKAARDEVLKQALDDGVITQDQYDLLLSGDLGLRRGGFPGFDRKFGPGCGRRGGHGPFPFEPDTVDPTVDV